VTSLEHALGFWRRRLSVMPVPPPRPGVPAGHPGDGKVPAIAWREYQTRLPTEAELRAWFGAEPMNLAVVTGAVSGVIVIDGDAPAALHWLTRHLPYTPWQTQTPRGFHLWYRHPGVRVPNRARVLTGDGRLAIDVRGDGGFVIAPGSRHASGAAYLEAGDWGEPRAAVPRFWPGWLERPMPALTPRRRESHPASPTDVVMRARKYLASLPPPEIGHGSDPATFYAASRLVRGFALSESQARALLWEWAGGRPGWTHEWVAHKVACAVRYGTEPIGGLQ
jgi:Bifunctional DNA primase/polymerase, N-terminal